MLTVSKKLIAKESEMKEALQLGVNAAAPFLLIGLVLCAHTEATTYARFTLLLAAVSCGAAMVRHWLRHRKSQK